VGTKSQKRGKHGGTASEAIDGGGCRQEKIGKKANIKKPAPKRHFKENCGKEEKEEKGEKENGLRLWERIVKKQERGFLN